MVFDDTWTESNPDTDTYANTLAAIITQAVKRAWRQRFAVDHYAYSDETGHDDVGYHKQVTLPFLASDPDVVTGIGRIYTKEASSIVELHFIDDEGSGQVSQITENGAVKGACPAGLIAMWHGTIANIPTGWLICDGENDTPNLLAKMVRGVATAVTDPGDTGGADTLSGDTVSHILTTAEMPAHTHTLTMKENLHYGGGHTAYSRTENFSYQGEQSPTTSSTGGGSGHVHSLEGVACIPAYYSVAFIMKQ